MNAEYDCSWDLHESEEGNLTENADAFDRKYQEWQTRDWMRWLGKNLTFPFTATREEDEDDAYFQEGAAKAPFRLGHTMQILGLEMEDDLHGIIVKAGEKRRIGSVPLCDLEVKPKSDKNYWPVREYVVWFANR
jgi:Calcium binding